MQMALPPRRKLEMMITAAATTTANKQTNQNPKVKRANEPRRQKNTTYYQLNAKAIIISSN